MGHAPAGLFGYSALLGSYPGGQAEYLRVPHADVGPIRIESGLDDDQVLFLSDIFPTGYMAAENAGIEKGDTVAIWGCGPVGQFAIQSAWMFGAGRVIAIDRVPERLEMARRQGRAETINFDDEKVHEELMEKTSGRGPDRCIDAVGAEAHGSGSFVEVMDKVKQSLHLSMDRPNALRQALMACRKAGTVSIPGVYIGLLDKIPFGAAVNKGLTLKMGQTHVQRYLAPLLEMIESGRIDPSFVISHRIPIEDAPAAYEKFRTKSDDCIKVVIKPGMASQSTAAQ
jgi:threonine dehydrogenase-like Zn-dependent dehydrogenase